MSIEITGIDKLLLMSARMNDPEGCVLAVKLGANPNACKSDMVTAAHIAAEKGFTQVLEAIGEAAKTFGLPLHLDTRSASGESPLCLAVELGRATCVDVLLQLGASPDWPQHFKRTPLHLAAFLGREAIVAKLLRAAATVNPVDCFDKTPLGLALTSRLSLPIVKWLLQFGADPNFRSKSSTPILSYAVLCTSNFRDLRYLTFLLSAGADVRATDNVKKDTALHMAAQTGYIPVVDLLVSAGANLQAENAYGETPLNVAIRFRNREAALHIYQLEDDLEELELRRLQLLANTRAKQKRRHEALLADSPSHVFMEL